MKETPQDPTASRYEHAAQGLRRSDLDPDPIKQFANCFTAAIEAGIRDVNAMSLATAGHDGKPSVRIVLLKGFDQDGFVFFTNYDSEKNFARGITNLLSFAPPRQPTERVGLASKRGARWTSRA